MSARKRRNRPIRRAPSRRPAATASEATPVELTPPEAQVAEPAEPAGGDAAALPEAASPEVASPGVGAAEEPESRASTAAVESEPEPAAAEPEIFEPETVETAEAEPEAAEAPGREREAADPEADAAVAAEPGGPRTEAETPLAASEQAPTLAEPAEAEPELGAREDRTTQPEPELLDGRTEPGFGEPEAAEPLPVEPEAEVPAPQSVPLAEPATAAGREPAARSGWAVLYHMGKPRLTKANLFAAVLAVGLGFAVVAQVQQTQNAGLESLREDELVRILDDFTQENLRLGNEIRELESSRDRLISGAGTSSEALRAAQERADTLGILAGTRPARGEGIEMTIADPSGKITAPLLLDALEELRDAGAEAVQIGGVRVVASSYFTDVEGGIELSGQRLERPYTILAIGDSSTLASAMKIPGGVVDTVRGKDGITTITEKPQVDIAALHVVQTPQYARPVPSPTGS
jgi:uncharacterized protein YlxW (UPF0749 family)